MRPTFYYEQDNIKYELRAGGVLFYKKTDDGTYFLMIRSRGKLEDFGGCTDQADRDIFDTISREVEEESNKIFDRNDIRKRLDNFVPIISKESKYMLFLLPLVGKDEKIEPSDFGNKEDHDNIERTVEWVNADNFSDSTFFNRELNFRLKINSLRNLYDGTNI